MIKRLLILILATMVGGSIFNQAVTAQEFPKKPIEIVCPFPAGASIDLTARLVADTAPKYLGQPMVVINKPGGAGTLTAADLIRSKADGYKLAIMTSYYFGATSKTQKLPFNPSDLVPITNLMEFRFGLYVKGDSPWKTLDDLLDYARKNPGNIKWGHPGRGLSIYISALSIFRKAGVETKDVPYKGSPQVLASLLGGHINVATGVLGTVKDHIAAGTIRYLTVYSDHRYSDIPDVPTVIELGYPEAAIPSFIGLYAHKDTPENIKQTLMVAFKKTYDDSDFQNGVKKIGEDPRYGGPDLMNTAIQKAEEVSVPILKEFGLYAGE
jgi:tripartite-type tricarboxylate transporter receptor subunit TctC